MTTQQKIIPSGRPVGKVNPTYALSKKQVRTLLGSCAGKYGLRNRAIISLCLHSGTRIGTAVQLYQNQIIDSEGKVRTSFVVQRSNEKSKRTHRYYLSSEGQRLIQDYVDTLSLNPNSPLFPSRKTGEPMHPCSATRLVSRLFERAGIEDNSSHALRKTFSTMLYTQHNVDILQLSMILNHSSINQTKVYIQNLQPNIENAMKNLSY
jgi:integrase